MNITSAIKSTIDKTLSDLANTLAIGYKDYDNLATMAELVSDPGVMILGRLEPSVTQPANIITGTFRAGCKLSEDSGNYQILAILDAIQARFFLGTQLPIHDYSLASASPQLGTINVSMTTLEDNQYDSGTNMRFVVVSYVAIVF